MRCTGAAARLRAACEDAGKGYVFAVPVNFMVTLPSGRRAAVASLARLIPGRTPAGDAISAAASSQLPWHWRDTGALPAGPYGTPSGDIRIVKVNVPEAPRLLNLTTSLVNLTTSLARRAAPRLPLVTLATATPGPRPVPPLPGSAPGRLSMIK